jgi:hypothetical protein
MFVREQVLFTAAARQLRMTGFDSLAEEWEAGRGY